MNRPLLSVLLLVGAASGAAAIGIGCARGERGEPGDARALEEVLAADQALEGALREVDALSRTDEAKAAEVVERRAIPLADEVIKRAQGVQPKSGWGRERHTELSEIAAKRRDALPGYARSLREPDLKAKLTAVEAQLDLQRRAMQAAARVSQVPP